MSETEKQGIFEGFAIVEMLGHRRLAGHVRQISMGTAAMLRVDVPAVTVPRWVSYTEFGEREHAVEMAVPAWNTFVSPASLYQLTPCSEEYAKKMAASFAVMPPDFVRPPLPAAIARVLPGLVNDSDDNMPF